MSAELSQSDPSTELVTDTSNFLDRFTDHTSVRSYLVERMRLEIYGPTADDSEEVQNHFLPVSPLQVFATGVLFPQKVRQEFLEDEADDTDSTDSEAEGEGEGEGEGDFRDSINMDTKFSKGRGKGGPDDQPDEEPMNLANEFSPSAAGVSFRLEQAVPITISLGFGVYAKEKRTVPHRRAGKKQADGVTDYPATQEIDVFQRKQKSFELPVIIPNEPTVLPRIAVPETNEKLSIHVTVRNGQGMSKVVSVMAVNERNEIEDKNPKYDECFYQVGLTVRASDNADCFAPIDREAGRTTIDDIVSMDLLYRHRRSFALGHGCAGDWERDETKSERGAVGYVKSSALPVYDLKPIRPRESAYDETKSLNLSMRFLYEGSGSGDPKNEVLAALNELADDYESWITDTRNASGSLDGKLKGAAERHLENCDSCLERIKAGIAVLENDEQAMLAFRLANLAMLMQQYHWSSLKKREWGSELPDIPDDYCSALGDTRKWRPFQLAFILMSIAGCVDPSHDDRTLVDLIWFPTGGGKTEAYLGLSAFVICLRRLSNSSDIGTVVLMRYTLRLLTAQQFQRAGGLILALEVLRRDAPKGIDLGGEEISIGLWVGKSLSPNKRSDALQALRKLQQKTSAPNPFQVLECPWCRMEMDAENHFGYRKEGLESGKPHTVVLRCPDENCRFGHANQRLPVYVVDEDLYDKPPTLLLGTVDKFAQIAWNSDTGRFFGIGLDTRPPELIIQDELHLISGPLGTIVGLYEVAIDKLCTRDGHTPKIIASTATIRRAEEQCWSLYHRKSFEFPPQAVRAGESYFAFEDQESAGRMYVGFMGNAVKSHQTALVRVCSALLQGPCIGRDNEEIQKLVDPYGTLVWYFNSLRELGHANTLCTGDIPENLKSLCRREEIPPGDRRYIDEVHELTSRRSADEIPSILQSLDVPWGLRPSGGRPGQSPSPVDVLLATNMISVGVDVSRLGLFVMSGQPKSSSEYIQATSRVGRAYPGLVVTAYTQTKSRDRSHYEGFVGYHQSIYRYVEPTSVTPFSPPARERGMRGLLIALARLGAGIENPSDVENLRARMQPFLEFIEARIDAIDSDEKTDAMREIDGWLEEWGRIAPSEYGKMGGRPDRTTLAYPYGARADREFQREAWPILTSMRNVDGTSRALIINQYFSKELESETEEV
jgi:hypothetical protein